MSFKAVMALATSQNKVIRGTIFINLRHATHSRLEGRCTQ